MSISEEDLKRLLKALAFAAHKHRDQRRKDVESSPYINHPIALANLLCNEGHVTDTNVICAALLHDTVEDTDTTPEELEREFGKEIRSIVMDVTDDKTLEKTERKQRQIERAHLPATRRSWLNWLTRSVTCVMWPVGHQQIGTCKGVRDTLIGRWPSSTGYAVCTGQWK